MWDENCVSNPDVDIIPSQDKVTQQILSHWKPFLDLKLMFPDSRLVEQLSLCSHCNLSRYLTVVLRTFPFCLVPPRNNGATCQHLCTNTREDNV